jgi:dTDP-4-dehydrorhamnose 3,5-epimerase
MIDTVGVDISQATPEWLAEQDFQIVKELIDGVYVKELKFIVDGRGSVIEQWSLPWVEREGLVNTTHSYASLTDYHVVKGWHLHSVHTEEFVFISGKVQVCLVDIRPGSPTFGKVNSIIAGTNQPRLIKIPPGIMHGWKSLTMPEVIVINYQSDVYDPADEFKFDWDIALSEIWEPKNG